MSRPYRRSDRAWLKSISRTVQHRSPAAAFAAAGLVLLVFAHSGCLFRKGKPAVPAGPTAPVRMVYLPFNVPAENPDLRWVSIAGPVLLARASVSSPDLEPVPLWEFLAIAAEAAGPSRSVTPEVAAYVASRLSARWGTVGEISPAKEGVTFVVDFIPSRTNLIPFRYQEDARVDALAPQVHEAVQQFLRYLVAKPLARESADSTVSLREIAEAIDREYGWYAAPEPGKAEKVAGELARANNRLARLLFSPTLYPVIGGAPRPAETATPATTAEPAPAGAAKPGPGGEESSAAAQPASPQAQPAAETPIAAVAEPRAAPDAPHVTRPEGFELPPPQTFTQALPAQPERGAGKQAAPGEGQNLPRTSETHSYRSPPSAGRAARLPIPRLAQRDKMAAPRSREKGYRIQVFASRSKSQAEAAAVRLINAGLTAEVEPADLGDRGTWYRIRLGGYRSRQAADEAGQKLVSEGRVQQYWVVP